MTPAARRLERPVVAALALAAVAAWLLVPTYPNYDAYYHLVWGREVLDGAKPGFETYSAPTQHPLYLASCTLLVAFGEGAERVLVLICVLSLVALAWAVFRLGAEVFGVWPGLAAAAFTGSSFAFLLYAARAYVDVPFLALVLWAAALEARSPRRGRAVAALLAVAGLLRPEAWVLAGAYWLWCVLGRAGRAAAGLDRGGSAVGQAAGSGLGRAEPAAGGPGHAGPAGELGRAGSPVARARLDLLALAVAAPVIWAAVDLWATGDPLYSLHATSDLADVLNRDRGLDEVPGAFASYLADTARPPVALAAAAGAVLAWRLRAGRALHVVVALFGAGALTFVGTGLAGLSILPRYLTVPVVALCVLAGYGLLGFTTLPPGRVRRAWSRAAVGAGVLGLVFVAARAPVVGRLATELRFIEDSHADLVGILDEPAVRRALRCGPLTFPNYRLVPESRWHLDLPAGRVGARSARRRARGVAVFVLGEKELRRFGFADGASPTTNVPDPGFVPVARNARFSAYAACP